MVIRKPKYPIPIRFCVECDPKRWDRNAEKPVGEFKNLYKCLNCKALVGDETKIK